MTKMKAFVPQEPDPYREIVVTQRDGLVSGHQRAAILRRRRRRRAMLLALIVTAVLTGAVIGFILYWP
jgi:hypothetical protein